MSKILSVDVHESKPNISIPVSRVGIVNFKRPIRIKYNSNKMTLIATIDIFVDIPRSKKGAHISRNIEAIDEIFENGNMEFPIDELPEYAVKLVEKLAKKHDYANHIEVRIRGEIPIEKEAPVSKVKSYTAVRVIAGAEFCKNDGNITKYRILGVELEGMTVCPNSYKMTLDYAYERLKELGFTENEINKVLFVVPLSAHNQRGTGKLVIKSEEKISVKIDELVMIVEKSMSSPVYPLLKRADEQRMVIDAHHNPRFTEDVVRYMVGLLVKEHSNRIPDDAFVIASQRNYESIHAHDVYSEIRGVFKELKEELNSD